MFKPLAPPSVPPDEVTLRLRREQAGHAAFWAAMAAEGSGDGSARSTGGMGSMGSVGGNFPHTHTPPTSYTPHTSHTASPQLQDLPRVKPPQTIAVPAAMETEIEPANRRSPIVTDRPAERWGLGKMERVAQEERSRVFGPPPETPDAIVIRERASAEAQQMVSEAIRVAEDIRADARDEGYRAGFQAGYAAGLEAARAEAAEEAMRARAQVQGLVDLIERERRNIWEAAEPQMIALALDVARRVVVDDALVNREMVLSVLSAAMRRVVDRQKLVVRVNPSDLENVRASRQQLVEMVDGVEHLEILDDRRVGPGGAVVETNAGTIDARVETQLDEIETALRGEMRHAA